MGVVPRQFYCSKCNRMRWPGDCEHARILDNWEGTANVVGLTDLCRSCAKVKKECRCPEKARDARAAAKAAQDIAHVLALTGCSCAHHVVAYLADDVNRTIECGACCSAKTPSARTAPTSSDVIDNTGRVAVREQYIEEAIKFGLSESDGRKLLRCERMPGWVSNGHFLAYAGDASGFFKRYATRDHDMFDLFKGWEAAGPGQRVYYSHVNCEPKDEPVEMYAWGVGGWTGHSPRPPVTIVAPSYHVVLLSEEVYREAGHDDDPLAMLIGWTNNKKIRALVMPRRETIIE